MSFSDFSFTPHITRAVEQCGFTVPTPIQKGAIPEVLAGRDLLGLAQTGTGKTAAFVLPLVNHLLKGRRGGIRTLILAPTRELAEQIHVFAEEITRGTSLNSLAVYGGVSKHQQIRRIAAGVDIIVACPGRLLDLLRDGACRLDRVEHLVVDEADHMFDQGFLPDVRRILKYLPGKRQSLVFSATMPAEIRTLTEEILRNPVTVQIDRIKPAETVKHTLYQVSQQQKKQLLLDLLGGNAEAATLVFTKTKHKAKSLAAVLVKAGFSATSLQGNLSQNKRQQALSGFRGGSIKVLVATDIAARGIDVSGIAQVINFDAPDTAEAYIHRTGRTGRAERTGEAHTFVTAEDGRIVRLIERNLAQRLHKGVVNLPEGEALPERERSFARPGRKPQGQKRQSQNRQSQKRGNAPRRTNSAGAIFGLSAQAK